MRNKVWVPVCRICIVFLYLWGISHLDRVFRESATENFALYPYIVFSQFAYIPMGLFLGADHLVGQKGRQGHYTLNYSRFIWVVLPLGYLLLVPYIIPVKPLTPYVMMTSTSVSPVIQVILGYMIVTSVQKCKKSKSSSHD